VDIVIRTEQIATSPRRPPWLKTNLPGGPTYVRVREVLRTLRDIEERPTPPQAAYGRLCRTCAYAELCWG